MKKIGRYVLILFLLLLALSAIGLLYLFFVPNSSLFGITYIGRQPEVVEKNYSTSGVKTVVIESDSYNVNIQTGINNLIELNVRNTTFGFVLKKNSQVSVNSKMFNNILTISITEPSGVAYKGDSSITLKLPKNLVDDATTPYGYNLQLTNNSAPTEINCEKTAFNSLSYKTNRGSISLTKGVFTGSLSFDLSSGSCLIGEKAILNNNNTTLSIGSGDFNTANNIVLGNVLQLAGGSGDVNINQCGNYKADLGTAGGHININKTTGNVNIRSSDTHVYIGSQTTGGTSIELSNSGSANINNLDYTNNVATISTNSGAINVNNCKRPLDLKSSSGNIDVKNAYRVVKAKTSSGDIYLTYHKDAGGYRDNAGGSEFRACEIETSTGYVNIENVENITLKINGDGSADVVMKEVSGTNKVEIKSGDVNICTPSNNGIADETKTHKYCLSATCGSGGNVAVNISGVTRVHTTTAFSARVIGYKNPPTVESYLAQPKANQLAVSATNGNVYIYNKDV